MSQDGMVEVFGGSKTTVNSYLRQLEKMKLLYVYRLIKSYIYKLDDKLEEF